MMLSRRNLDNSWLLAPNERLEGTRLAAVRLRPVRAALLVPERDTKAAAAAVESCCISWGGFANLIVPYSEDEGIREPWRKIIEVLAPDLFVCFEDEPPDEVDRYLRSRGTRNVLSHGSYQHATLVIGTIIYSALNAFMPSRAIEQKRIPLMLPRYRGFPEKHVPFLARYGSMLETTNSFQGKKHVRNLYRGNVGELTTTHRNYFDVRECQINDYFHFEVPKIKSEVFVGDLRRVMSGEERSEEVPYRTLPEITLADLTHRTSGSWREEDWLSESRKHDGRVVVLGDYPDVENLALFWTLRGQKPSHNPFPIFLPDRHVYKDRAKDLIDSASGKLASQERGDVGRLHITSAVFPQEHMEDKFRDMFPNADITPDIADFFDNRTIYYVDEQQQPVFFRGGTAHVQRIRPPKMEGFTPDFDHVVHEVEIEGIKLPAVEAVENSVRGPAKRGSPILTTKGAIRSVEPYESRFTAKDFLEISMPDGWGLLEAFFEHYGYECIPTAKSQVALGQIGLLGGVQGINVVANSKVYEAIKGLCGTEKQKGASPRPYRADRKAQGYSYFAEPFGNKNVQPILRWLIENRILQRGANIKCPRCRLNLWYGVDRIGERWTCDGCREDMPIPIGSDAVHWRYRVNELWANGQDQGTVTPLLALYAMHAKWGASFDREGFGYYPGIELKKQDAASVPLDHIEVDLIAFHGGKPILVECKESAGHLETQQGAQKFAGQLADQVKLAKHIGACKAIIASPSTFPQDKGPLTKQLPADSQVEIEWWDKDVLLDPLYFAGDFKPDTAEEWHLEMLANSLGESSEW